MISESRIRHLEMLQVIVARMASVSSSAKTLAVTFVVGAIALVRDNSTPDPKVLCAVAFGVVLLALIDGQYLARERAFRKVYDEVRLSMASDADFDMTPKTLTVASILGASLSLSVLPFYTALIAVLIYALGGP